MHQPGITDASVARAIDEAVLKYYPDYAEAANISGMVQDLVKGTLDSAIQLANQMIASKDSNAHSMSKFYEAAMGEVYETVRFASSIRQQLNLANVETKAIFFSAFLDDMIDYTYCIDLLAECCSEQR